MNLYGAFLSHLVPVLNLSAPNHGRKDGPNSSKEDASMKFVIIGGDAAGMSAASRAKRQDPSLEVSVLEQTQTVSYSA